MSRYLLSKFSRQQKRRPKHRKSNPFTSALKVSSGVGVFCVLVVGGIVLGTPNESVAAVDEQQQQSSTNEAVVLTDNIISVSVPSDVAPFSVNTLDMTVVPNPEPEPEPEPEVEPKPVQSTPAPKSEETRSAPKKEAPPSKTTADSTFKGVFEPAGVPWGYDCGGVGKGIMALAIWGADGSMRVCLRNDISAQMAPYVAHHELQHIYQYRVMAAHGMSLDATEAHLATLYSMKGMNKSGGNYPHLEIAADCGTLVTLGSTGANSYISKCSQSQLDAAKAFRAGNLP